MFSGSGVSKSKLFDYDGSAQSQRAFISPELFSWRCPFCLRVCCLPSDSLKGDPEGLQFLCFRFRPPATQSIQERHKWKRSKKSRNTVLFTMFSGSGVSKSKLFDYDGSAQSQRAFISPELFSWRCPFCLRVCCLPSDSLKGDPEGLQFLCFRFRPPATQSIQERHKWKRSKKSRNTVLFPMFSGSGVSKSKLFDYDGSAQSQRAFISPELFSWRCPFCLRVCCLPSDSLKGDPEGLQFLCFRFRPPATQSIQERHKWKRSKKSRNTVLFPIFSGSGVSESKLFDKTTEVRKANARLFRPNYSVGGVRFACASAVFPATRSRVIRKDCNSYASCFARPPPNPSTRGKSDRREFGGQNSDTYSNNCVKSQRRENSETMCCFQCFFGREGRQSGHQKVHAAVAPSACRSQNFKSTSGSVNVWKLCLDIVILWVCTHEI